MTITPAVQRQFFDEESKRLIYLPSRQASSPAMIESIAALSVSSLRPSRSAPDIGSGVDFFASSSASPATSSSSDEPFMPPSRAPAPAPSASGSAWTEEEHERFLLGLDMFPSGPWKAIARCVGSRTARQTMSHAQKYRQKIGRRQRQRERQRKRIGLVLGDKAVANSSSSSSAASSSSLLLQQQKSAGAVDTVMRVDAESIAPTPTSSSDPSSSSEEEKGLMLMGDESPLLLLSVDDLAEFMAS